MKKKVVKLTERKLTNIIKRVIKEQSFASGSDDPDNEVFEYYYKTIMEMYDELGGIENSYHLEYMIEEFYGLVDDIGRDKDLNDDEADELIGLCSDALKELEDMESDFYNDDDDDI